MQHHELKISYAMLDEILRPFTDASLPGGVWERQPYRLSDGYLVLSWTARDYPNNFGEGEYQ